MPDVVDAEGYAGIKYDFLIFDEAAELDMAMPPSWKDLPPLWERDFYDQAFLQAEISRITSNGPSRTKPRQQTFTLPPPPTELVLQFIGGPKNAEQEFVQWANRREIQDGAKFDVALYEFKRVTISSSTESVVKTSLEKARYKAVFIPRSETPFSDAQIVICVFQP